MGPEDQILLREVPQYLLHHLCAEVWVHTASVFGVEGRMPVYGGTATCVAFGGRDHLLTAAHVWRKLRGDSVALSLESDGGLCSFRKDYFDPIIISSDVHGEWGPDLALIPLPDVVAKTIKQVKAFYNIDRWKTLLGDTTRYDEGLWALIGAPAALSVFAEQEAVLGIRLLGSRVISTHVRERFDYVDLSYYHEGRPELPRSYGGLSGSGLWHLPISKSGRGDICWNGQKILEGVAFYEKPSGELEGVIRCHGRRSVYDELLARVVPAA